MSGAAELDDLSCQLASDVYGGSTLAAKRVRKGLGLSCVVEPPGYAREKFAVSAHGAVEIFGKRALIVGEHPCNAVTNGTLGAGQRLVHAL